MMRVFMLGDPAGELRRVYDRRFEGRAEYRDQVWRTLVRMFFCRYIGPTDTILDLGCGHGEFINNVEGRRKYAMDLNPGAREVLRRDIIFLEQNCAEEWPLNEECVDVVFTSNFFEHLPSKEALGRTLSQAWRCLRRGGRLIALGPNIKFAGGAYWDFWDHCIPLTERSLQEALEVRGFRCEVVLDRFLPYTMSGARRYPAALIGVYLRMPFLWRWFGKQFLVVAQRV